MNLVIDAGNTQIKLGVFQGSRLVASKSCLVEAFPQELKAAFENYPGIGHAILASVGPPDKTMTDLVKVFCPVHVVSPLTRTPYRNTYATTQTLGADRMALASAAFFRFPKTNTLVIDAGSCITYDFLNDFGEYLGGAISPGLRMRYRALNAFTARLPLLEPGEPPELIGNATETSMHIGVVYGLSAEIDGMIDRYKTRYPTLTVILTGGDALFLSKRLKNTIFAHSNFLLEGLNQLLEYNKS
ncbi:type III pantothenate kinase [Robiginitalea sp. M366]|uniref:type III pantothenate kinase n=1 Tax=Robiginitalea aestuariiviva TaxID=3036903 RepID=UPI00240DF635|nr:type III pantothenate kinase [Robiginitalea aestuariiviva]MDG1571867.1 type III pantothenate kinase [Robiginitalea aestuariiviva]